MYFEEEYNLGKEAFEHGLPISCNPFEQDTAEYADWRSGWIAAEDEKEENGRN